MSSRATQKLFVLDTNVLMHDPSAIYRFHEHDVFLPMIVLEELDHNKKGVSEVARNARQVSRFLNSLMENLDLSTLEAGICISPELNRHRTDQDPDSDPDFSVCRGRLFFQTKPMPAAPNVPLLSGINDNEILNTALFLQKQYSERVILVSKDINLRIKAAIVGMPAEDYYNDKVLDDVSLLPSGMLTLADNFWEEHSKDLQSWSEDGRSFYQLTANINPDHESFKNWVINQTLIMADGSQYIVRDLKNSENNPTGAMNSGAINIAIIEPLKDYTTHTIWGIKSRNEGQNVALNLLTDPNIDFVTLLGPAGTGKTLLALAAGLSQVMDNPIYNEIIMTRATIPVGEDIGFLPGSEEEKMAPWMGALTDNLEVLSNTNGGEWGKQATSDLLSSRIKIRSLNFMRGRTLQNKFLIIDEAQNLSSKQMKTLITRAGPNTKVICLGNLAQIDTPFLSETTSGLTYVVDKFTNWAHSGHVTLIKGERSRLSDYASEHL